MSAQDKTRAFSLLNLTPQQTILMIFAVQSFSFCGMPVRIPDLQVNAGLDEFGLGLALAGQPIGAITMFFFASRIIEKFGTRACLLVGIPLMSFGVVSLGLAYDGVSLFIALLAMSAAFALTNIAMNVEADRVEAATDRRIMNSCHGVWSIVFLASSLLAVGARSAGISPLLHFSMIIPFAFVATFLLILPMRAMPERAHRAEKEAPKFVLPTLMTFALVGFVLGGNLLEGGTRQWSIIFMRETFDAPIWLESMTLPAFLITMSIGRLIADRWVDRFGPVKVARTMAVVALTGLSMVVFGPNLWVSLAGFALIGFGASVSFPMALSAAARLGDRPASQNVAAVTMVFNIATLFAPTALGLLAEEFGLRAAFGALFPFVLLSLVLARFLAPPAANADGEAS